MSDSPLPDITRNPPPLDIQHDTDPAEDHGLSRRIPHLGHTLLFFSIAAFSISLSILIALLSVHGFGGEGPMQHPLAGAVAEIVGYLLTFLIAVPVFPLFWTVTFWQGIHWNPRPAKLNWWKLILVGVLLSIVAQVGERFLAPPTDTDVMKLFATPLSAWLTVTLGTFIPAFVEEIAFRGFLMTSLAIAYDWLSFPRTPAGVDRWQRTNAISNPAWIFGAVFSSIAFASMHALQLHGAKGPLFVLFAVSLLLSFIRVRLRSVAASTIVHAAYNGLIFLETIIATGGLRHLDRLH